MQSIRPASTAPLAAQRPLMQTLRELAESGTRLATGQRINRGADDPAGLITSENFRAVLAAIDAETRGLERAQHVVNTADGALGQLGDLLVEAQGFAVASAGSTGVSEAELQANQLQLDSILSTVNRIAGSTTFNGQSLLDGSFSATVAGEQLSIDSATTGSLGRVDIDGESYVLAETASGGALNLVDGNIEGAQQSISAAIQQVATMRGELGAFSTNVIDAQWNSLNVAFENIAGANSIIRDTDFAGEIANFIRLRTQSRATMWAMHVENNTRERVFDLLA